tara:strand:+ start:594 stop:1085 length:492 start_codon:yes stop_codon:yes gene_type:complete
LDRKVFKKLKVPESIIWESTETGWILNNLEATIQFGMVLNQRLENATLLLLEGQLGSGKTSLVKGIAKALEINDPITSPTFSISQHYLSGKRALIHMDLYRIENHIAANELFLQEEETASSIEALMVVEWPSRLNLKLNDAWFAKIKYWNNQKRLIHILSPSF